LGAALPGSGGSYHFLSTIYGQTRWGRLIPFLFVWQFAVSGTLEMASGYIGALDYLAYIVPDLATWRLPGGPATLAALAALAMTAVLCRPIGFLGPLGVVLAAGTIVTVSVVIVSGIANFRPELITLPPDAFRIDRGFFAGLGGAMLIAIYDYLGYYNVCHLGDEVVEPGRTIPRAVVISILVVASIYLCMNTVIIGVVPWQRAMASPNIAAEFMETLYGRTVAVGFTALILWTVAACLFAIQLGYSRVLYAAARNRDFLGIFARVHPVHGYPGAALVCLGLLTAVFCYWPLPKVIDAAVTVRIVVQFIGQIVGLHLLRRRLPAERMPFRMWLYPLPSLIALAGWLFVLGTSSVAALTLAAAVLASGTVAFLLRERWVRAAAVLAAVLAVRSAAPAWADDPSPAAPANDLASRGVEVAMDVRADLPAAVLRFDAPQGEADLKPLAGPVEWERFSADSVNAPVAVTIEPFAVAGTRLAHRVHASFALHAPLERLQADETLRRSLGAEAAADGKAATARLLTAEELAAAGIVADAGGRERLVALDLPLLNRVRIRGVVRTVATEHPDGVEVAWQFDDRLRDHPQWRPTWTRLEENELGARVAGEPQPYGGCGGIVAVRRLAAAGGLDLLAVESRMVLAEPEAWFQGGNLLRSKIPLATQEGVRSLRRRLESAR
jgi:amino acid transporter